MIPDKYSSLGIIGLPSGPFAGEITKAAKMEATAIQILESAKCRPGHMLNKFERDYESTDKDVLRVVYSPPTKAELTNWMRFSAQVARWIEGMWVLVHVLVKRYASESNIKI